MTHTPQPSVGARRMRKARNADLAEPSIHDLTLLDWLELLPSRAPHPNNELELSRLLFLLPETHIPHHRSRRPTTKRGILCALPPPLEPISQDRVRRRRLVGDSEDNFSNGISWLAHLRTPISRAIGFLLNLCSFSIPPGAGETRTYESRRPLVVCV